MANIRVSSRNYSKKISKISAGDTVILDPGNYYEPFVLQGLTGTAERPIILTTAPDTAGKRATFKSEITETQARLRANKVAKKREKSGYYPAVGHLGEQAMLILRNCQFVFVDGLDFDGCWPSGIFIDNSKYLVINACHFHRGTLAIVAQGSACHDVIVQNCYWKQDTSKDNHMWNSIPWDRIHGATNNSALGGVDVNKDYRHWDGDFFRAWNVQSNFTFRHNRIEDAFNGIHFFNSRDRLAPGVKASSLVFNGGRQSTVNVLIENNEFIRVRDNVFEPEYHAWNWVIRHNLLLDCYRPFSFEFERAGWIYVYGNSGAFVTRPSGQFKGDDAKIPPAKSRRTPSLFKTKGIQANEGPIYVFNNSWYFKRGKGLFPKMHLGRLIHLNNATQFKKPKKDWLFGKRGRKPSATPFNLESEIKDEEARFTRRWKTYTIEMDGDICNDTYFPAQYRSLGYKIGYAAKQGTPKFRKPDENSIEKLDFTSSHTDIENASIGFALEFPDATSIPVPSGFNLGAVQDVKAYEELDEAFGFLPDHDWFSELSVRAFPDINEIS